MPFRILELQLPVGSGSETATNIVCDDVLRIFYRFFI